MTPERYAIGSVEWAGLSKLVEECGEVIQVAGKILAGSPDEHWDGTHLPTRMANELGDLLAAVDFFLSMNPNLDPTVVLERRDRKTDLFDEWHTQQRFEETTE